MDYRSQILTLASTFAAATGKSEARIATIAAGSGAFFDRIKDGAGCSVDTYIKVKRWFAANWPDETPWPQGVDHPAVLPDVAAE